MGKKRTESTPVSPQNKEETQPNQPKKTAAPLNDGVLDGRLLLQTLVAFKKGDFSVRMPVTETGLAGKIADTLNDILQYNENMAREFARVGVVVGKEGKIAERVVMPNGGGSWTVSIDAVNSLITDLARPISDVACVIGAVSQGDLSQNMDLEVDGHPYRGEFLQVAKTVNSMVEKLRSFGSEVIRVAREVGIEGKLGGQAEVKNVAGVWKELTDSVNSMAGNLTAQVRNIADVTTAVAKGDLSKKITVELKGEILELKNTINTMVDQLNSFAAEVTRVAREVGTEGKLGGQAEVKGVAGVWKELTDSVNSMAGNLTAQVRNIADVTTAVAKGTLARKITVDAKGEILELKNTINTMVDQLNSFAAEVTRVAREVGTEGKLGGQAYVQGVGGTWKDLTDSVNFMAANLTAQVRNIAEVTTAVANGTLLKKITVDAKGEILELKNTINTMVVQLSTFASEVTRVAREVGTEGKLGGQAEVEDVAGIWKDLTDNVNSMAGNLTSQVRNIAEVTTAVAKGDLSKKITVDARGEIQELKNTMNIMVDQLSTFASEVTRVAREVGTDGRLGGQATVKGVGGTWKDLTDSVNSMAGNLTTQVRNIAQVTTAVANGDLSKKITADVKGEILELKNTINTMVDQLSTFASEVTRVAREVGTDGRLGGQATVKGVGGTWKDLTDSVNSMAGNLTAQVRNIAEVTTAVANGDLSKKITADAKGEILALKNTINTMVDQLSTFASEVTRVAREVGTDGRLGGQGTVKGVGGTWKDLTDNVNMMAANLTNQVRNIAQVTTAVAMGDLSKKITVEARGEILDLKNTINTMVDQLRSFASEVTRVAREVGTEGRLGGQSYVQGVAGTWKDLTDNVNMMAANLTNQVRNIAQVTTAVAMGDLAKKITVDAKGEILELKSTINTMVDQLNAFASEVTRVAREVGTEGKLGGQAEVKGVSGTWKDLTDNVNMMAANLTSQVRGIAKVVTAIANGNLKQKLALEAKGEIATLAETINNMIDTLTLFADQVTTVAREVGVEGKLGGQAKVPGTGGVWKDLTANVNQLAANLTTQIRAIAEVATAVTKGDLTRTIKVEAMGEVASLKDNLNEMMRNLRDTTQKNTEQDWLKTNLAKFSRMLQGQKDLMAVAKLILSELAPVASVQHGVFYMVDAPKENIPARLKMLASYAYKERKNLSSEFRLGEGLVGQCCLEKSRILITNVPGDYIQINSGLGQGTPLNVVVIPVVFEGTVKAVMEIASFERFSSIHLTFLDQLTESIGIVLNTIEANMRTEDLLKQSQSLAAELQTQQEELKEKNIRLEQQAKSLQVSEEKLKQQQEELQRTNEDLEAKARLLLSQNNEVEKKNNEVEKAKHSLEEKATQLAITSKYKSEFLANMSHELRTPLNSLLILGKLLADNAEKNLTDKQIEFAKTIHASGTDLLNLINDILDLAKIESGTVEAEPGEVILTDLRSYIERSFRHVAESKKLEFGIAVDARLPQTIYTDAKRLQQVIKNLLSNAFKFTESGRVEFSMQVALSGWSADHEILNRADTVVAFSVKDTGIGIPVEKHKILFESFQQVDGSTSRKYGGTGLGLSISREIAKLLGGEVRLVSSEPGKGSIFVLYLPKTYTPPKDRSLRGWQTPKPPKGNPAYAEPKESPSPVKDTRDANSSFNEAKSSLPVASSLKGISDDREQIQPGDRVVLIVEDDIYFVQVLIEMAHKKNFKGIVALDGEAALSVVKKIKPDAIILDIRLQGIDGWAVLDRLKHDSTTRHIPVHVVSVTQERLRSMKMGAVTHLVKPVTEDALEQLFADIETFSARPKKILIVEDDKTQCNSIVELVQSSEIKTETAGNAGEALARLKAEKFDCLILDLMLPDMSGFDLLRKIKEELHAEFPIIVYTAKDLTREEDVALKEAAQSVIVKNIKSPERLLAEVTLFMHQVEAKLPEEKKQMLQKVYQVDSILAGRKLLIVDDDMRNIFALTSILEQQQMKVSYAENGKDGIEKLKNTPGIELVLMDIMMPEMDGYETMRLIRKEPQFLTLPIIALTAKAMKGDREKCIEAGASDYISKPVEPDQLLSLLRVWLYR